MSSSKSADIELDKLFYHTTRQQWMLKCEQIILKSSTEQLKKYYPLQKLLKYAPVFTPWFNEKSQQLSQQFWGDDPSPSAFQQCTELLAKDRKWLVPELQQEQNKKLYAKARVKVPGEQMQKNVSEAKEKSSYHDAVAYIKGLYSQKCPMTRKQDTQKNSKNKDPATSNPGKPANIAKQLKLSEASRMITERQRKRRLDLESTQKVDRRSWNNKRRKTEEEQMRILRLRLYPSSVLAAKLKHWLQIYQSIILYCNKIINSQHQVGQKESQQSLREQVQLTQRQHDRMSNLERLQVNNERLQFVNLPSKLQEAAILQAYSQFQSAQTNLRRGNIRHFQLAETESDMDSQVSVMNFSKNCVSVKNGHTMLLGKLLGNDGLLVVKDQLLGKQRTSTWISQFKFGKNGHDFKIQYDTVKRHFFILLSYNSLSEEGPFTQNTYDQIKNEVLLGQVSYSNEKAMAFVKKREHLRCDLSQNTVSIDPGVRTPVTLFDFRRKSFFALASDVPELIRSKHEYIACAQSTLDSRNNSAAVEGNTQRRLKNKRRRELKKSNQKQRKRRCKRSVTAKLVIQKKLKSGYVAPYSRSIKKAHQKLAQTVSCLQNRISNYLASNYDTVVLPEFMSAKMILKRRKHLQLPKPQFVSDDDWKSLQPKKPAVTLPKLTRKDLARFGHHKLRQKIISKFQTTCNKRCILTTEEFTSKQHPLQMILHKNLGSSKVWKFGNFKGQRDNVGSYNVGLRSLTKEEICFAGLGDEAEDNSSLS